MRYVKVHGHVVAVRSSWTPSTLPTSSCCCCLHLYGHRLLSGIIPMPGSSPTLLLAPTSRPVLTEQPSCSSLSGPRPTSADIETSSSEPGADPGLADGGSLPGRQPAAGEPTTDDGFRRPLWFAGGACAASCARVLLLLLELRWKVGFGRASQPIPSLFRPWLSHSPKP